MSFSLHFAENMLNMPLGIFLKCPVLYFKSNQILYHFSSIFLFLNDVFTLFNICSICLVLKTR